MLNYLEDTSIFREDHEGQCEINERKVNDWVNIVRREEQLGEEEGNWILCSKTRPTKIYANIKAHTENWPYRYIISCNQSVIEKLAQWVEFQLKYLARQHSTYLKDTKHFLNFTEEINEEQGPFKENEIIMVNRDIKNFYPSCETRKCLSAVESVLPNRRFQCSLSDCILEAIKNNHVFELHLI